MTNIEGTVFDIQKYSIHDGPGIRTVVFLKGCPLRCLWCCNPESQKIKPQLSFFSTKCIGCLKCIEVCPENAIKMGKEHLELNRNLCSLCGKCAEVCFAEAWVMLGKEMNVEEVMNEIIKDVNFYSKSGGGVTLSGGEPCFQWQFAFEILRNCKEKQINTAIETTGFIKWEYFKKILNYADLLLYDIKHMDSAEHEELTGVSNKIILDNLRKAAKLGKDIVIRVPVIPSLNDSIDNYQKLVDFVSELKSVSEINLLPYHELGVSKYEQIGYKYKIGNVNPPLNSDMEKIKDFIESEGFKVKIGG